MTQDQAKWVKWVGLFSRLDRAIDRHRDAMADSPLTGADEELYAAHEKVLKAAARRDG